MIEEFIKAVMSKIQDKGNYYSQADRMKEHGFDCSSLIIRCLKEVGIKTSATYTGNMDQLTKSGFEKIPITPGESFQRGDILVKHIGGSVGHTVLYLGNNKIAEAASSKLGLRMTDYYPNGYQYILRYNEKTAGRVLDLPKLIRNGDKNIYVGFLQLFLNKYNGNRLVVDCDFGRKTEEALKNFQVFKGLEVDGIAGVETWTKVYSIMAQG